jgi:hypothetical protein
MLNKAFGIYGEIISGILLKGETASALPMISTRSGCVEFKSLKALKKLLGNPSPKKTISGFTGPPHSQRITFCSLTEIYNLEISCYLLQTEQLAPLFAPCA